MDSSNFSLFIPFECLFPHFGQVRAKHASLVAQREELLRLTAESHLLLKDNEVIRMQLNVAVSMYGAAAAAPLVDADARPEPSQAGSSGVTDGAKAEEGSGSGQQSEGLALPQAGPAATGVAAPLEAVFQRMRTLESQNMGLMARNEALAGESDGLRGALEAALSRLEAFKGLAATVGMIRGKKPPSSSSLDSGY